MERPSLDPVARALARAGVMPLSAAEAAVRAGRVRIAGRQVTEPQSVVRRGDEVRVDGRRVSLDAPTLALMFHKPRGVVTSTVDPHGAGTVFERLYPSLPRALQGYGWHAAGRLDRDTTGLLLFTNDERLVEHLTSPKTHLPKRYLARVQGSATAQKLAPLTLGVTLPDGQACASGVRLLDDGRVELTLTSGRYHQVKRMLAAVGLPVMQLHREAVGALVLDVPEGAYRQLTAEELASALGYPPA